jgi:tRNA A37 threonylcarbamoyladenosine synthetase subunit TsaC/SUA5/YrdC
MKPIRKANVANTADPVPAAQLERDVSEMMDVITSGGIAIFPLDLTYAIVGHRPDAIRRIFAAKARSFDKPCGMFGSWRLCRELHDVPSEKHEIVRILVEEEQLPFSVVAPFRPQQPLVINGGYWLDEVARQSIQRNVAVFGSSANRSLNGSKYRLEDIEPEVREVADVSFDYGLSKYSTPLGLSSTIIDLGDFSVVRVGHRFDELVATLAHRFGIMLPRP